MQIQLPWKEIWKANVSAHRNDERISLAKFRYSILLGFDWNASVVTRPELDVEASPFLQSGACSYSHVSPVWILRQTVSSHFPGL